MTMPLQATDGRRSLTRFDATSIRAVLTVVGGTLRIRIDDQHSWEWLEFTGSLQDLIREVEHARSQALDVGEAVEPLFKAQT